MGDFFKVLDHFKLCHINKTYESDLPNVCFPASSISDYITLQQTKNALQSLIAVQYIIGLLFAALFR